MKSLIERCDAVLEKLHYSPAVSPICEPIPQNRVNESLGEPFQRGKHYFLVRVNEMYLSYSREWFKTYLPMVLVVSEFWYGGEKQVVPFVVGPSMVEQNGIKVPDKGMVFFNTRVAGIHPYRGGRLILTVMLCRVERKNHIRRLLQVIESAASVLDFSTALSTYIKVAHVVLDGVDALFDSGPVDPVIGIRQEFDPDAGDGFGPGYHVLMNPPSGLKVDNLWVRDRQLAYGADLDGVQDFRDADQDFRHADYVLYSIMQTPTRADIEMLPFYSLWKKIQREAKYPGEHGKNALVNMVSLWQTIGDSPDLTEEHGDRLADEYYEKVKKLREKAENRVLLGEPTEAERESPRVAQVRSRSLSILDI